MIDILLINVPQISLVYPPAATSLLKGICETNGFSAKVKDFNLELYTACDDNNIKTELDQWFSLNNFSTVLSDKSQAYLDLFLENTIQEILKINPRWLGISVFTFQCQIFTTLLLKNIRSRYQGKIVVGGAGLSTNGIAAAKTDFAKWLLDQELIDYYIRGEGDRLLIDLLNDRHEQPGINNDELQQIENLDLLPYPNYEDVVDLPYQWSTGQTQLPITGSRGCIRSCSFCDIHVAWPKYRYRSGELIAKEMIEQYNKHNVTSFWFTDSLINGSMKTFRSLCNALIDFYNQQKFPKKFFRWGGQFVVRDSKSMTVLDYQLAAEAGMNGVAMGVESLSESVRDHMKKGFSNDDLDFTLSQMHKNDMNCYFLMMVGYPTETSADFQNGIDKFNEYQPYALDGTIYGINLGTTVSIDEGTPLFHAMNSDPLAHREIKGFDWVYPGNPELTFKERIRRRIFLQEELMRLGYKIWNGDSQLIKLKEAYDKISHGTYKTQIWLQVAE